MEVFISTGSKTVADFKAEDVKMTSVLSREIPAPGKRVKKMPAEVVIRFSGERYYEHIPNTNYKGSITLNKDDVEAIIAAAVAAGMIHPDQMRELNESLIAINSSLRPLAKAAVRFRRPG